MEQKDMRETQKDTMSDFRTKLDALLDGYRDAAFWAGYKDAKDEILELQVRGEL